MIIDKLIKVTVILIIPIIFVIPYIKQQKVI